MSLIRLKIWKTQIEVKFIHSYPMESFRGSCMYKQGQDELMFYFGFICRWFQLKGHLVVSAEGFESASFLGFLETE